MKRSNLNLQTIVLSSLLVLSATVLFGMMISNNNLFGYYHVATAQGNNTPKATTATTSTTKGTTIQLTSKEVSDGVYRWIDTNSGAINPKLKVFENTNNIIKIQNPTDTKHQLIIDTGADELPASGVVAANGNGQLSFNPNQLGTFTYHCAFHPFMMQGTIQIVKP